MAKLTVRAGSFEPLCSWLQQRKLIANLEVKFPLIGYVRVIGVKWLLRRGGQA
jgi:hypothetical protein